MAFKYQKFWCPIAALSESIKSLRFIIIFTAFLSLQSLAAQEDFLAKQYLNDGEYEKALVYYEKLVKKNASRADYLEALVACYQQLERYEDAENQLLKKVKDRRVQPAIYVELGYNATLKGDSLKSKGYYKKALKQIEKNANYGYRIGERFQKYALLENAIEAYTLAMQINPALNYNVQLATIYGEQGAIEKMYKAYLSLLRDDKVSTSKVLRRIEAFINSDAENENNIKLKKILLQNAQKDPNVLWNELLSWLFVQQKQFNSAFRQEKAVYKRMNSGSLQRMANLGTVAIEEKQYEVAQEIFAYIVANSNDERTKLNAELQLIAIQLINPNEKQLAAIDKQFKTLMAYHGFSSRSLELPVAYANFLTFSMNTPEPAISLLKKSLDIRLKPRDAAYVKLALGDILVYDQKFNQALIYFTQIQKSLKNDVLGQDARYKVAQTSFYKGDFDWALTQLKVLRSSTSQLIANDAMHLSLLISDNSLEDSTQTALKKYARADLLSYQNKTTDAMAEIDDILKNHKGEKIEDDALLKQAELLELVKDYEAAELNYLKIIEFYADGILADDAYFALGELYRTILNKPEKAKARYEKIIYNYQDSYYFPQARKHFRTLRGDNIN